MLKRLLGELPAWMRTDHPLLRYELQRHLPENHPRARILRVLGWSLLLAFLILVGYFYATDWLQRDFRLPYTLDLWRMLYYPLFALQLLAAVAGFSMATAAISEERRRQTWDNLRATELGAASGLRTRWFSIFYRLRGLFFVIVLARLLLIAAILYELTSMQGMVLDILANRSNPPVPLLIAVLLLAAYLTAMLLLPVTSAGVDIAIGLLLSSGLRNRGMIGMLQIVIVIVRVSVALLALWGLTQFLSGQLVLESPFDTLLLAFGSVLGDAGLALSQLSETGQIWSEAAGSIFLGAALLGAALLQIALANWILGLAIHTAERVE